MNRINHTLNKELNLIVLLYVQEYYKRINKYSNISQSGHIEYNLKNYKNIVRNLISTIELQSLCVKYKCKCVYDYVDTIFKRIVSSLYNVTEICKIQRKIRRKIRSIISFFQMSKLEYSFNFKQYSDKLKQLIIRLKKNKQGDFKSNKEKNHIQNTSESNSECDFIISDSESNSDSNSDSESGSGSGSDSESESDSESGSESDSDLDLDVNKNSSTVNDIIMMVMGNNAKKISNDSVARTELGKAFKKLLDNRKKDCNSLDIERFEGLSKKRQKLLVDILKLVNIEKSNETTLERLLTSGLPYIVINEVLGRLDSTRNESESNKYNQWLEGVLNIPFGKFVSSNLYKSSSTEFDIYFKDIRLQLDKVVYGHTEAKKTLVKYIAQMTRTYITKPTSYSKGLVIGIQGPCGNGKTTLIEKGLSKVLNLPFRTIPLGGACDISFLNGHSYTYEGSSWGQIVDILMKTKCSNPIIYMDELDKVSDTPKGREIINNLIHVTDPSQNTHFQDRYFGNIDIDLSHVTWVFSYNDAGNINHILRDRITEIRTGGFSTMEKTIISKRFLIPSICETIGMSFLDMEKDVIEYIIEHFTFEGGVRKVKELLFDIYRCVNIDELSGAIKLSENNSRKRRKVSKKFKLDLDTVKSYMKHKVPMIQESIHTEPLVGRVNGLYASSCIDVGGIIQIETKLVPSDHMFGICLTGNLGTVMTESAIVSKTLAWNYVSVNIKSVLQHKWSQIKESIHVHCPEGAVSKDGPSAGTALTIAMISLLTNTEILNTVGITGEINLSGEILAIGGLRSKLHGAKKAGCTYPKANENDMKKIRTECEGLLDKNFRVVSVSKITDVFQYVFKSCDRINLNTINTELLKV